MKVVVCKDEDAQDLLRRLELKRNQLTTRFRQQDKHQEYVASEVMRAVHSEVVVWLQEHGFKVTQ